MQDSQPLWLLQWPVFTLFQSPDNAYYTNEGIRKLQRGAQTASVEVPGQIQRRSLPAERLPAGRSCTEIDAVPGGDQAGTTLHHAVPWGSPVAPNLRSKPGSGVPLAAGMNAYAGENTRRPSAGPPTRHRDFHRQMVAHVLTTTMRRSAPPRLWAGWLSSSGNSGMNATQYQNDGEVLMEQNSHCQRHTATAAPRPRGRLGLCDARALLHHDELLSERRILP